MAINPKIIDHWDNEINFLASWDDKVPCIISELLVSTKIAVCIHSIIFILILQKTSICGILIAYNSCFLNVLSSIWSSLKYFLIDNYIYQKAISYVSYYFAKNTYRFSNFTSIRSAFKNWDSSISTSIAILVHLSHLSFFQNFQSFHLK